MGQGLPWVALVGQAGHEVGQGNLEAPVPWAAAAAAGQEVVAAAAALLNLFSTVCPATKQVTHNHKERIQLKVVLLLYGARFTKEAHRQASLVASLLPRQA